MTSGVVITWLEALLPEVNFSGESIILTSCLDGHRIFEIPGSCNAKLEFLGNL